MLNAEIIGMGAGEEHALVYESIPITEPYPQKEAREKVMHSFVDSKLDDSLMSLVPQQDDVTSVCFAVEESMNTGQSISIKYLSI